ncbi:TrbG/VirB9 family P-type conjugative transfer protein [Salmonella enterica]|nr:TrbG/VirB9 family P-type conjugative transfer protein [Salmonella enterica]
MKWNYRLIMAAICCASGTATAAVVPYSSPHDARIQYVHYSPDNVVILRTKVGQSTLIQFADGENVLTDEGAIGFGDSAAWNLNTNDAGNSIFIKPKVEFPDTNFQVITNKRTYVFSLVTAKRDSDVTWFLNFIYPAPPKSPFNGKAATVTRNPCAGHTLNTQYEKWGDNNLAPARIWDNGRFTCIKFSSSTDGLPIVNIKLGDGTEAQTNFHFVDDVMVIHEVAREFRLRLGKQVMGISTDNLKPLFFNYSGTTTGEKLEVKSGEQN